MNQQSKRQNISAHCNGVYFVTMFSATSKAKNPNSPNQQRRPSKHIHPKSVPQPSQKPKTLRGYPIVNRNSFTYKSPKNHAETMTETETYRIADGARWTARSAVIEGGEFEASLGGWRSVAEQSAWAAVWVWDMLEAGLAVGQRSLGLIRK